VSFRDNLLMAIDLATMELCEVLRDVGNAPFDVVVDHARGLAFVSNFQDDTVTVIRLPRGKADYRFQVAAILGTPRDRAQTNPDVPTSWSDIQRLLPMGKP
jgi:DNA-binding beta-propeller fold protein YncE